MPAVGNDSQFNQSRHHLTGICAVDRRQVVLRVTQRALRHPLIDLISVQLREQQLVGYQIQQPLAAEAPGELRASGDLVGSPPDERRATLSLGRFHYQFQQRPGYSPSSLIWTYADMNRADSVVVCRRRRDDAP